MVLRHTSDRLVEQAAKKINLIKNLIILKARTTEGLESEQ